MDKTETDFTPALGSRNQTKNYDNVIAVMTREGLWRGRMLSELSPKSGQKILDIGSGTGSWSILVKQEFPDTKVIALDPDPDVRRIAERKATDANVDIQFLTVMGNSQIEMIDASTIDLVTISLVLHQCPMKTKTEILSNAYRLLRPGGRLLISDYGKQRSPLMSLLFNQVRIVDGYQDTKANKDGLIPQLMRQAGFQNVDERKITPTPTGSISLYVGQKAN